MSGLESLTSEYNRTTYCDNYACGLGVAEPSNMITSVILGVEFLAFSVVMFVRSAGDLVHILFGIGFLFAGFLRYIFAGLEHGLALDFKCGGGREFCIQYSWLWVVNLLVQILGTSIIMVASIHLVVTPLTQIVRIATWVAAGITVLISWVLIIVGAAAGNAFLLSTTLPTIFVFLTACTAGIVYTLPVCCCKYGRIDGKIPPGSILAMVGWYFCGLSNLWGLTGIGFHKYFNHNDIKVMIYTISLAVHFAGLLPWMKAKAAQPQEPKSIKNNAVAPSSSEN